MGRPCPTDVRAGRGSRRGAFRRLSGRSAARMAQCDVDRISPSRATPLSLPAAGGRVWVPGAPARSVRCRPTMSLEVAHPCARLLQSVGSAAGRHLAVRAPLTSGSLDPRDGCERDEIHT